MDIPCSGHAHHVEFTISSAPNGWHRVEDRFGAFDRIPTRMDVRLFLIIDGRSLGYNLSGDSVRQDTSELLRGLYQLILSSFELLPPCLKGNANGWANWCRTMLQEMGRFRINPYVARQFQNALALLVSGHSDERRQIECELAEGWNPNASDEADATAKALFEKMLPWAAEMLQKLNYVWLASRINPRLRYRIERGAFDKIHVREVSSGESYLGWLCLEVNLSGGYAPMYDRLLQRLLLLQNDEAKVWRVAYFHSVGSRLADEVMHQMGGRPYRLESDRGTWHLFVRHDGPVRYEPMTGEPQTYAGPVPSMRDILLTGD